MSSQVLRMVIFAISAFASSMSSSDDKSNMLPCDECIFERIASCGGFLEGPVFNADGALLVVDLFGGRVLRIEEGACVEIATTGGAANGARLRDDGAVWVADQARGILELKEAEGDFTVSEIDVGGSTRPGANDLVFDKEGGAYFTAPGPSDYFDRSGRVYYLPPGSGRELVLLREGLAFPNGLALSADEKYLYVGEFAAKRIVALPSATNRDELKLNYVFLRTTGGIGPDGMILDTDGRLVWANFGAGTLGIADATGHVIGEIALPPEAGRMVTNVIEHEGAYYVTEAGKGEVWRLPLRQRTIQ